MSQNSQPPRYSATNERNPPVRSRERLHNPPSNLTLLFQRARDGIVVDDTFSELKGCNATVDERLDRQHRERIQRHYGEQLIRPHLSIHSRPKVEDIARSLPRCKISELDAEPAIWEGQQQQQPSDLVGLTRTVNPAPHRGAKKQKVTEAIQTEHLFCPEHEDDEILGEVFEMVDYEEHLTEDFEEIVGCIPSASNGAAGEQQGGF